MTVFRWTSDRVALRELLAGRHRDLGELYSQAVDALAHDEHRGTAGCPPLGSLNSGRNTTIVGAILEVTRHGMSAAKEGASGTVVARKPLPAVADGDDQFDDHGQSTTRRREGVARGVASRARAHFPALAPAEVRVCEFVTANPEQVIRMSLQELAAEVGVSDATALRFCRAIGFSGFTEMKMALVADNALLVEAIFEEVTAEDSPWNVARKCFNASSQLIADTMELLDRTSFDEAVEIVDRASSILIFAAGTSIPLSQDLETRLFRLGRNPVCVTDPFLQLMRAALVNPDDAVVVISRSGAPPTILPAIREARPRGGKVVTITASAHSPLAEAADVVLLAASREIRAEAMASLVPLAAITEALAVSLALRDQRVAIRNERAIWRAISPWRAT